MSRAARLALLILLLRGTCIFLLWPMRAEVEGHDWEHILQLTG